MQHLPLSLSPAFPGGRNCSYSNMSNERKKGVGEKLQRSCCLMKVGYNRVLCCAGTSEVLSQLVDLADVCYVRLCLN